MKLVFLWLMAILIFSEHCYCQLPKIDSPGTTSDSNLNDTYLRHISLIPKNRSYNDILNDLLVGNQYVNYKKDADRAFNLPRKGNGKEWLFYLLAVDILLLGIFRAFYSKYFNNIFRVFFNTSLRQNQLTDILLQARLPSLIFNLIFIVNGGLYLWLVLMKFSPPKSAYTSILPLLCVATLGVIYIGKFFTLKILGWITGMAEPADTYIFVIFLINKIIGIILLPFIIMLAFSPVHWERGLTFLSFAVVLLLFLLRFYRSYGLLENQFTLNRFHFLIYVIALEVIPVLILYKMTMNSSILA
ncbi:MAG: DUF4271 domain-containing protein [Ginsengibacter sp.]